MTTAVAETPIKVPQEKLRCQHKRPHNWTRPVGIRGKKPTLCPKHKPETPARGAAEPRKLHCELGNHEWERPATRGRVPANCSKHKPVLVIKSAPRNENGKETLTCELGKHEWERVPSRGRKPRNCPEHPVASVPVTEEKPKRKPGRPKVHETKEAQEQAALEKSRERASNLEGKLKERGTHISQQTPYILYKNVAEKPARKKTDPPTITWERVAEHSPLTQAKYVEQHADDFEKNLYRYERDGKIVVL